MTYEHYVDILSNKSFCIDIQNFLNGKKGGADCHTRDSARDILYSEFFDEFMSITF